jgi:hypothetical protein
MIFEFFKWCDETTIGVAIRNSKYLFPIIESIHILALTALMGAVIFVDLRLLGVGGMNKYAVARVAKPVNKLTWWGIFTIIATGIMLFLSEALKCYDSPPFRAKMILLALALIFQVTVWRRVTSDEDFKIGSGLSKATAVLSMVLWFGIGFMGRAIGFY